MSGLTIATPAAPTVAPVACRKRKRDESVPVVSRSKAPERKKLKR